MKNPPFHPRGIAKQRHNSSVPTKPTTTKTHSRPHKNHDHNLRLALAVDNENLNTQLRTICDDVRNLRTAHSNACQRAAGLQEALTASEMELQEVLVASEMELQDHQRMHNHLLQDLHLDALMEREDLRDQLEAERMRLVRKMEAERKMADDETAVLRERIRDLEESNEYAQNRLTSQAALTKQAREEMIEERSGRHHAMSVAETACEELDCARLEVNSVRDDLTELLRLDTEEKERGKMGLPPAYGGLDNVDQPPWELHCQDVGRLDGGACGMGMSLLESVTEENFGRQLRKASAIAGKLRQSQIPGIRDGAGITLFRAVSEGIANACVGLLNGMDKVVEFEHPPKPSSKKRRLSASSQHPMTPSSAEPAMKKIYNSQQRQLPTPQADLTQSTTHIPSSASQRTVSNHSLAHRAIGQTFSLLWQLLAAFELRPLPVNVTTTAVHLQLSSSWRVIDDCLRQAIDIAAKSPLKELDDVGRCTGCEQKGCAGNCIRLGRLQGYSTQLDALMKGLQGLITNNIKTVGFLVECADAVQDMVATERRCAADGRSGGSTTRHVEFLELDALVGLNFTYENAQSVEGYSPASPRYAPVTNGEMVYHSPSSPARSFNGHAFIPVANSSDLGRDSSIELETQPRSPLVHNPYFSFESPPSSDRESSNEPENTPGRPDRDAIPRDSPYPDDEAIDYDDASFYREIRNSQSPMRLGSTYDTSISIADDTPPQSPMQMREQGIVLESPISPGAYRPPTRWEVERAQQTSPTSPVESVHSWWPSEGSNSPGVYRLPRDGDSPQQTSPESPMESEEGSMWLPDGEEEEEEEVRMEMRFTAGGEGYPVVSRRELGLRGNPPRGPRAGGGRGRRSVYGEGSEHGRGLRILGAAGRMAAQRAAEVRREGLRPRARVWIR